MDRVEGSIRYPWSTILSKISREVMGRPSSLSIRSIILACVPLAFAMLLHLPGSNQGRCRQTKVRRTKDKAETEAVS